MGARPRMKLQDGQEWVTSWQLSMHSGRRQKGQRPTRHMMSTIIQVPPPGAVLMEVMTVARQFCRGEGGNGVDPGGKRASEQANKRERRERIGNVLHTVAWWTRLLLLLLLLDAAAARLG